MLKLKRGLAGRIAFTLPEVLVTMAIIATLTVVALPAVMNKLTEARAAALAETLDGLNETIQNYRGNVGRYPRTLSQLSVKPTTGALEACQAVTPDVNINQWRGPYTSRTFTASGTKIGDATVQDALRRVPSAVTSTSYGVLYVDVVDVDSVVASHLETSFDGTPFNYSAGTVWWSRAAPLPAGPVGTLSFGIPVRGC
jgi:prepilin-type N-terminal cleavage/methylation domain-containing protein